jgi:hypothetical protein
LGPASSNTDFWIDPMKHIGGVHPSASVLCDSAIRTLGAFEKLPYQNLQ